MAWSQTWLTNRAKDIRDASEPRVGALNPLPWTQRPMTEQKPASNFRENAGNSNTTTVQVHDLTQDPWLRLGQHLELLLLLDHRCLHRFQLMLDRHQIPTWLHCRANCGYDLLRFGGYRTSTLHGQGRGDDAMLAPDGSVWAQSVSAPPRKAEMKGTLHNSARLHNSVAAFQPVISDCGAPAAFFQSEIVRRSGISCYGVSKICEYQTRTRKCSTSPTTPLRISSIRGPLSMSKIASVGGSPMHWTISARSRKAGSVIQISETREWGGEVSHLPNC